MTLEDTLRRAAYDDMHIVSAMQKRLLATLRDHLKVETMSDAVPFSLHGKILGWDLGCVVETVYRWRGRVVDKQAMLVEGIRLLP